jgi:hypothetical protein
VVIGVCCRLQRSARGAAVDPAVRQPGPAGGDGVLFRPGQRASLLGQMVQGQRRVLPLHAQPAPAQSAVSRPRRRHGREFFLSLLLYICMPLWDAAACAKKQRAIIWTSTRERERDAFCAAPHTRLIFHYTRGF